MVEATAVKAEADVKKGMPCPQKIGMSWACALELGAKC